MYRFVLFRFCFVKWRWTTTFTNFSHQIFMNREDSCWWWWCWWCLSHLYVYVQLSIDAMKIYDDEIKFCNRRQRAISLSSFFGLSPINVPIPQRNMMVEKINKWKCFEVFGRFTTWNVIHWMQCLANLTDTMWTV